MAQTAERPHHSQGSLNEFEFVDGPCAWYSKDYAGRTDWVHQLSQAELEELDAAVNHASALDKEIQNITREEFQLPTLSKTLEQFIDEVKDGRGFVIIRGVPVDRYTRREVMIAYWGLGLHWGKAVPQNKKGHLIGHIKDIGHDPNNPVTRLYATSAAQPWHNDAADAVALLCLKNAKEGGLSSWSSSVSVYNEMLKTDPDLVELLAGDWFMDRKNEVPAGKLPYFRIPVFNFFKGYLSVNFSDNYYHLAQRHPEVPRLTDKHLAAIARFNELAASPELRLDMYLQPGDIQLISNHTILHTRGGFVDYEDINMKRHLLRLWLAPPTDRPLPECYEDILGGSVKVGNRGGIRIEGYTESIVLEAE